MVDGHLRRTPALDITSRVMSGVERGLYAIAFSPNGSHLYVSYSDSSGADRLVAFRFEGGRAVTGSARTILTIPQPGIVHHAGDIQVDADGNLWMSTGDATLEGTYSGLSQSRTSLLGKLLRIHPTPEAATPYTIPPGNPGSGGRREIYASGLRNPWRFSIDAPTATVWIGDVGQYQREEIDRISSARTAPVNFGWDLMEGSLSLMGRPPANYVGPLLEYSHTRGRCAVIGGVVYRGTAIASLGGAYVYTDYCDGRVRATIVRGRRVVFQRTLGVIPERVAGFGEDAAGELYLLALSSGIYELVPAS